MKLFSENDLFRLAAALSKLEELEIERSHGTTRVKISTRKAGKAWTVAMILRVEVWKPGVYETQYIESIEEAKAKLEQTQIPVERLHKRSAQTLPRCYAE